MEWKEVAHPVDDLENFKGEDKTYRILVSETHDIEYEYRGSWPGQNYGSGDVVATSWDSDYTILKIMEEVAEDGQ